MNERLVNRLFMCNTNGVFFEGGEKKGDDIVRDKSGQVRWLSPLYIFFFLFKWRRPSLKYLPLLKKGERLLIPIEILFWFTFLKSFSNEAKLRASFSWARCFLFYDPWMLHLSSWNLWEWHKWFRQPECANIIIRNSKQVDLIYKEWRRRKGSKLFCERIPYNTHLKKKCATRKIVKKKFSVSPFPWQ